MAIRSFEETSCILQEELLEKPWRLASGPVGAGTWQRQAAGGREDFKSGEDFTSGEDFKSGEDF